MTASHYQVRRATIDDLPQLGPVLKATLLPAAELEKRFTEFQIVENENSELVGALGLRTAGKQGEIHSETYSDFALADQLRPMLWERLKNVAVNHGLVRLWTQETAPFWKQAGFEPVTEESKKKLPAVFNESGRGEWLTLELKKDIEEVISLDKEFALFIESEKARTQELFDQAKMFKTLAYLLAVVLFLFVIVASVYLLKNSGFFHR